MLLRQISSVIAAASLAGCASRSLDGGETGADGTASASGEGGSESSSGSGEGESGSEASSDSGDPVKFDLPDDSATTDDPSTTGEPPDPPDTDGGDLCGPFVADWEVGSDLPESCGTPPDWGSDPVCFFPPDGTACEDEPYAYACILAEYNCGLVTGGDALWCGPYTTPEGACCYVVTGDCAVGRPLVVDGLARTAALVAGDRWSQAPTPSLAGLDRPTRAALADAWRRHGQSEHASIASFARFSQQLLALGAPAELVAASLTAGADERRHALRCFGLADAYAQDAGPRQPGPLVVGAKAAADTSPDTSPVAVAVALASEACVAETVSLELLVAAHAQATDPAARACLAEMIADEREHVLLGWAALAWMCREFGAPVRAAVG